jgi:Bacterial toxin 37
MCIPVVIAACEILIPAAITWGIINSRPPQDAYNPDGAKAPGRPSENDGFRPPKGGDDWVPNPNGRGNGWRDRGGSVWVPTGPGGPSTGDAHGGPHWDVQRPGGGYDNVYPGGKVR